MIRQKNIGVSPSGKATDSDSVIRWFESSYPSHGYHILYKEYASKYNIWFLFYMAYFILPQIGERIGVKTRIRKTVDTYCFSRVFRSERICPRER